LADKIHDMLKRITDVSAVSTPRSTTRAGKEGEDMSFESVTKKLEQSLEVDKSVRAKKIELMERVRSKVLAIARMNIMLRRMRENKD